MLHTHLCDLLGIEHPVVQAAIWPATAPELVAAVCNAGGLGSLGAAFESAETVGQQLERVRELTSRPFAVNHVVPILNEDAFRLTLEAKPAVISLALGDPGTLVERAHAVGAKVIHQIHTLEQAQRAAALGVDAIIAQGSEAGGQGLLHGSSSLVLIRQVVDAVRPLPVLAAGGIADGYGLAAALVLGAQGVNIGTRFLASHEAAAPETWKQSILTTASEDVIRFELWQELFPPASSSAYPAVPRVIRTPFVDGWRQRPEDAKQQAERLRAEIMAAVRERRPYELLPFSGQTVGLIHEILPAGEIVHRLVAEAEAALQQTMQLVA